MKVYKVSFEDEDRIVIESIIDAIVRSIEICDIGETIIIEVIEMTEEKYYNLSEE